MDSGWNSRVCAEELRPASPGQSTGFAVVSEEELVDLLRSACKVKPMNYIVPLSCSGSPSLPMNQKELCFVCFDKTFKRKVDDEGVLRSHVLLS